MQDSALLSTSSTVIYTNHCGGSFAFDPRAWQTPAATFPLSGAIIVKSS